MDFAKLLGREPMTIEEIDEVLLKGKIHASDLNSPRSSEFVVNNRNQKLHVRSFWPAKPPKAFMIFLHGYASHGNRPTHVYLAEEFGQHDIGYVTLDFHTHGYSDCEIRCHIEKADDLVDDVLSVLLAFFSNSTTTGTYNVARNVHHVPFFFIGHSMGGGVSFLLSNLLSNGETAVACTDFYRTNSEIFKAKINPYFRGALLMGPLVKVLVPDWLIAIVSPVAYWLPTMPIPTMFRDEIALCRANWRSDKYINYVLSDSYPTQPNGLMYMGGMRLGTAQALLDTAALVTKSAVQANYPFLIVHDPNDVTVNIEGSRFFVEHAPTMDKTLIELDGGRHDPIANHIDIVFKFILDFVHKHWEKKSGAGGDRSQH